MAKEHCDIRDLQAFLLSPEGQQHQSLPGEREVMKCNVCVLIHGEVNLLKTLVINQSFNQTIIQ